MGNRGRTKTPDVSLTDLRELRKRVREIKRQKAGVYKRWQGGKGMKLTK